MCSQYLDILELYKSYFPKEYNHWRYLADFYYVLGEHELCLEIRKQVYELSGLEWYEPEEHSISDESDGEDYSHSSTLYRDEYGRDILYTGKVKEKIFFTYETRTYERKLEYGENGKLIQIKTETIYHDRGSVENLVETLEYDSMGRVIKIIRNCQVTGGENEEWSNESTYIYDESGFTLHFISQMANGDSSQYDQDYELDEYGEATKIGQEYNDIYTTSSGEIYNYDHSN